MTSRSLKTKEGVRIEVTTGFSDPTVRLSFIRGKNV